MVRAEKETGGPGAPARQLCLSTPHSTHTHSHVQLDRECDNYPQVVLVLVKQCNDKEVMFVEHHNCTRAYKPKPLGHEVRDSHMVNYLSSVCGFGLQRLINKSLTSHASAKLT